MKLVLRYIAVVMVCVGLAGCGSRTVDARLAQVNDLANAGEADSAIAVLQAIEKTALDEYNSRYHDLMAIKTRDKTDADITGDTAIIDIMAYFEAEGPDEVRGEAYYYGGRVYREMGDAPQALDYFQKAQDAFPQYHAFMKGKIASQMGQIFLELYMHEHAKSKFQEAIHYQKECRDTSALILNLRAIGQICSKIKQTDSTIIYYKQAVNLANSGEKYKSKLVEIQSKIVDYYISNREYDKAQQEYTLFDSISSKIKKDYVYYTKINFNIINKQYDKVQELAQELTKSQSVTSRQFAYSTLANYAKFTGNETKAYDYIMESYRCQNKLNNNASRNAVIHQNSLYNYALREKESSTLKQKQQLLKQKFYLITVCFLVVICLLLYAMYRNRKLKLQLALQINNLMKIQNGELNENKLLNNENITIEELQIEYHKEYNKLIQDIDPDNYIIPDSILKSKIYQRIKQNVALNKNITSNDLHKLDLLINKVHKSFTLKLHQFNNKISEHEYQICLLTKCKFSNIDISNITNRERSGITKAKTRLFLKLFKENGSAKDFDKFILSL